MAYSTTRRADTCCTNLLNTIASPGSVPTAFPWTAPDITCTCGIRTPATIGASPAACGQAKEHFSCRHGLSYIKYHSDYAGIDAEQKLFVAMDDPVEIWDVKLRNDSDKVRHLSVFSYLEFSFHQVDMDNKNFQMSLYATGSRYEDGVIENDLYYEEDGYQFFTSDFTPNGFDSVRDSFIGATGTERDPLVVETGVCGGSFEKGGNLAATAEGAHPSARRGNPPPVPPGRGRHRSR